MIKLRGCRLSESYITENGAVSIPQSLLTASQEAWRELEQLRGSFASLAPRPHL